MTTLYRHFDVSGALLYVGISICPFCRLKKHKNTDWFSKVVKITVSHFRTRRAASNAEMVAIKTENPIHNISGSYKNQRAHKIKLDEGDLSHREIGIMIESRLPFNVRTERERKLVLGAAPYFGVDVRTRAIQNGFQVRFLAQ